MKPRFTLPQDKTKPSSKGVIGGYNKQTASRAAPPRSIATPPSQAPIRQPAGRSRTATNTNTSSQQPSTTTRSRRNQAKPSRIKSLIEQPFKESYSSSTNSSKAFTNLNSKRRRLFSRNASDPTLTNEDRQKKLERSQKISSFKGVISLVQFIVGAIALALFITNFVFQSFQVVGSSMQPTLQQDDWLIISKVGKSWNRLTGSDYIPSRGEIVVFNDPRTNAGKSLIKRVIALPGETVKIEDGKIVVYNDENPLGFSPDDSIETITRFITEQDEVPRDGLVVPVGEIFVAGDNRVPGASLDSRTGLGTVPADKIIGILNARLYPLSELKKF